MRTRPSPPGAAPSTSTPASQRATSKTEHRLDLAQRNGAARLRVSTERAPRRRTIRPSERRPTTDASSNPAARRARYLRPLERHAHAAVVVARDREVTAMARARGPARAAQASTPSRPASRKRQRGRNGCPRWRPCRVDVNVAPIAGAMPTASHRSSARESGGCGLRAVAGATNAADASNAEATGTDDSHRSPSSPRRVVSGRAAC